MIFISKTDTDQSAEDYMKIYGFDDIDNINMWCVSN